MTRKFAHERTLRRAVMAFAALMSLQATAAAGRELRVCGDPNNLPFSNRKLEGFENKIAALIARDLHASVRYAWMPQRRGFFRRTLQAKECDVVMGVPARLERVASTRPYYRSTYVFVSDHKKGLKIKSFDDPILKQLKIGIHTIGADGANTPPAHALAKRGIIGNVTGFPMWDIGSVKNPPGTIVDAVVKGDIDLAIIWGPFGGYFAKKHNGSLDVVPVPESSAAISIPVSYDMSIGVRKGDDTLKDEIQTVLDRRRREIHDILADYRVPLVEAEENTAAR